VNTFDRYLLKRFWYVAAIAFVAAYGLFIVFDAINNLDDFQNRTVGQGSHITMLRMAQHYVFQAFRFFDLIGPILIVLSVMAVFATLQRQNEIFPILSAGVPTWRLAVPITVGALSILLLLTLNQELIIPEVADRLQAPRGTNKSAAHAVQTTRDYGTNIEISGEQLYLPERKVESAEFLLPVPELVVEPVTLRTTEAIQIPARGERPAGWLLRDAQPRFHELALTEKGREHVFTSQENNDLFVKSDVTIDQLHNRTTSFKYLSTAELIRRIRSGAIGRISIRSQTLHLHERLTRPLLILLSVLITIALTMRKESTGLLLNVANCTTVLGVLFLITQATLHVGRMNLIPLEVAAWIPVALSGTCTAWLASSVQT
jgi:lipopolysaccharide export system permease protein